MVKRGKLRDDVLLPLDKAIAKQDMNEIRRVRDILASLCS